MLQRVLEMCLCLSVIFIVSGRTAGQTEPFLEDDTIDDTNFMELNKRGWGLLRLGRGLQMLRLGKRANTRLPAGLKLDHILGDHEEVKQLTSSQVKDLVNYLFDDDDARDDVRRQPPLPRYGRESRSRADDSADLELYRQLLSKLPTRQIKPTPRGGRYRRSLSDDYLLPLWANYRHLGSNEVQAKAALLSRFGRPKADKNDVAVNDQSKNSVV
ncbi:myomodulin neuropeptides 2-like [Biomphalaria glabrata]|uniref:Myomodulin neuropeptides 2-like n=1 Tax=Biomphalaria glabrata TaxID=6526 RepID=A0A9W3BNR9_BIOGL|nr:myomodulin neuropeptides 2-like [Biomphalaria glabrata]